jgi:hypothetical protein
VRRRLVHGQQKELSLHFITFDYQFSPVEPRRHSAGKDELRVIVAPDERILADLRLLLKTEKYVKRKQTTSLSAIEDQSLRSKGHAEGAGLREIAQKLTDEGVPSPPAHDPRRNSHCDGGRWAHSAVRAILLSDAYTGRRVWAKQQKQERLLDPRHRAILRQDRALPTNGVGSLHRDGTMTDGIPVGLGVRVPSVPRVSRTNGEDPAEIRTGRTNHPTAIVVRCLHGTSAKVIDSDRSTSPANEPG